MNIEFLDADSLGNDMDLSVFRSLGRFRAWNNTAPEELQERLRDAHVIITNRITLGEAELSEAGQLKLICLTATGFNNVDTRYCARRGIGVCNVAGYSTESVAQHTFSMLFYLLEHLRYYDDYIREERYLENRLFADVSRPWRELAGKTWGIIGLGSIGRRVAVLAEAFGARTVYASTSGICREEPVEQIPLEELLKTADVVSVHAPLNGRTECLLGEPELGVMKSTSILLNLGRGAIIDEDALIKALTEGTIAAAGLDVLIKEPPEKDSPLLPLIRKGRLFVTPHNAWGSVESRARLVREVAENIRAFKNVSTRNRIV